MTSVPQLSNVLQTLLTDTADTAAHLTRFVQRRSKLSGAVFVQTLVFGWLANPQATLEQLTKVAALRGVSLSPQALDQRFTERAAHCLLEVLNAAVQTLVCTTDPVTAPLLERFRGVYVHDSSILSLPHPLGCVWPGCGNQNTPSSKSAALKLQVRLELGRGMLDGPHLQSGRIHDSHSPHQDTQHPLHSPLPVGALRIADLGFFSLDVLGQLQRQQVYWLTRVQGHTALFDEEGVRRQLGDWLGEQGIVQQSEQLDLCVQLGATQRLPCRLIAVKVPADVAAQRKRKLRQQAKRRGHNLSRERLKQAQWNIFVTNVPTEKLSIQEALVLARCRWQIELLFKLWKSHGRIDEWRTRNAQRIMCEVYAKLLAMVIQHWLLLVSCWAGMWEEGRSMVKAASTVRQYALHLAVAFGKAARLIEAIHTVQNCIGVGCRINKSRTKPPLYQLLLQSTSGALA
jgi:hypothetical protein